MKGHSSITAHQADTHQTLLVYLLYIPTVLLAPINWAPYVAFGVVAFLFVLPIFLLRDVAAGRYDVDQPDETRVVFRGKARKGSPLFRLTALASFLLTLGAILGGSLYNPALFHWFPWGVRLGLAAIGVYMISPIHPVEFVVMELEGQELFYRSRSNPLVKNGYDAPGRIRLSEIRAIRLSTYYVYQGESHRRVVFTLGGESTVTVLVRLSMRKQLERFLRYLAAHLEGVELQIEPDEMGQGAIRKMAGVE